LHSARTPRGGERATVPRVNPLMQHYGRYPAQPSSSQLSIWKRLPISKRVTCGTVPSRGTSSISSRIASALVARPLQ
jgi:hypothetical protein